MRLYGSFSKVDSEQRIVSGYASTECIDRAGEVVLISAIAGALDDYLEYGNIRAMHQLIAVGKTVEAEVDEKGLYVSAHIVDDDAWKKVVAGVYAGFSIGGKTLARDPKNKNVITKIRLDEISIVDRPANPEARIDIWKAAGLHDGSGADLAKVTTERNSLAKQLARREVALADLADRVEVTVKTVASIVADNKRLLQENADLTKRLAAPQMPRIVNAATISKTFTAIESTLPDMEANLASIGARLDHIERGGRLDA